ncbi:hypothetical protein BDP27DRAFT_1369199 [Rhodocollybia butyracea]|uniref:O-methyltransferase domain-containing protein n=1 Tax=Rhodocollybia butyracea TaxID=206335 RepID=A0A9P5U142_9AGAR|nr:hypothetical protein BDP27DRAFT_1369199 [Rhodocollybia butyracea]
MSATPLTELGNIVISSIQTLEAAYTKPGIPYPSLDEPYKPGPLDDDFALGQTTRVLIAAAYQIIATIRGPMESIQDYAPAMYLSSSLGVAVETNIPDIVKDSGLQILNTRDISAKAGIDESKTARILRYVASRHAFRGVFPNVFANNRISSVLVKAHSLEDIKTKQYEGSPAAAYAGHLTDESLKSAAYISKFIEENPTDVAAPFNMALDPTADMWTWYEKPVNNLRLIRLSSAMKGSGDRFPPDSFTKDVGGSVGSVPHLLVKAFPDLKYVVQDLPKVIGQADERTHLPPLLRSHHAVCVSPSAGGVGLGVGGFHTMFDMQMMTMFNGQERTLPEFIELGRKTGWQLQSVHVYDPLSGIMFVPV